MQTGGRQADHLQWLNISDAYFQSQLQLEIGINEAEVYVIQKAIEISQERGYV